MLNRIARFFRRKHKTEYITIDSVTVGAGMTGWVESEKGMKVYVGDNLTYGQVTFSLVQVKPAVDDLEIDGGDNDYE